MKMEEGTELGMGNTHLPSSGDRAENQRVFLRHTPGQACLRPSVPRSTTESPGLTTGSPCRILTTDVASEAGDGPPASSCQDGLLGKLS